MEIIGITRKKESILNWQDAKKIKVFTFDYIGVIDDDSRKFEQAQARAFFVYYVRMIYQTTYQKLGLLVNRDHTSVIASIKKLDEQMYVDKRLRAKYHDYTIALNEFIPKIQAYSWKDRILSNITEIESLLSDMQIDYDFTTLKNKLL